MSDATRKELRDMRERPGPHGPWWARHLSIGGVVHAHRQRLGDEITGYAHEIKTHALAKLGELLRDMPKATGTRGQLRGSTGGSGGSAVKLPERASTETLAELGIDRSKSPTG